MRDPDAALTIVLAFWRRTEGAIEFFVPFTDYMTMMQHVITGNAAVAGRTNVELYFGINPRCNARVFRLRAGRIVGFALTTAEAKQLAAHGAWLPAQLMNPMIGTMLSEIADRL